MIRNFSVLLFLFFCQLGISQEPAVFAEKDQEQILTKRIYSHLIVHDPIAAVEEAKNALDLFPKSKSIHLALISSLSEKGDEIECLEAWKKSALLFKEISQDRIWLETLAWGILKRGEYSSLLPITLNSLIGVAFTQDAKAIPILLRHLQSSHALLRSVAVRLASNFGDAPLQDELSRLLKEEKTWYVRLEVIEAIGRLRMAKERENLKKIIGTSTISAEEKTAAIISLVNMYETIDLEELYALSRSDRSGLRQLACLIVAHLDFKEGIEEMISLLKDHNSEVRGEALTTLGLMQVRDYKGVLTADLIHPLMEDHTPEVSITAAWASIIFRQENSYSYGKKVLRRWIESSQPEMRRLASAALAATGPFGAKLSLKLIKNSQDSFVRANLALGLIRQRESVPLACKTLYEVLTEEKQTLFMWDDGVNSIFRSLSPSRIRHIAQIPNYPMAINQLVRLDILSILSILRFDKAEDAVKELLQNQNWGVTGSAVATLLQEGDEESLKLVKVLLEHPEEKIRIQAALILGLLGGDVSAVKVLQEAYPKVDRETKIHIIEAIAHIGDSSSIPFLLEVVNESFQVLRVVAASALIQCLYH